MNRTSEIVANELTIAKMKLHNYQMNEPNNELEKMRNHVRFELAQENVDELTTELYNLVYAELTNDK